MVWVAWVATFCPRVGTGLLGHRLIVSSSRRPDGHKARGRRCNDRAVLEASRDGLLRLNPWVLEANDRARAMYERRRRAEGGYSVL